MAKQKQTATSQPYVKNRSKTKPSVTVRPATNRINLTPLSDNQLEVLDADSIETQQVRLGDERLQNAQRQFLAAQMGRVQGNQHLQRLMVQMKSNGPMASPAQTSQSQTPLTRALTALAMRDKTIQRAEDEEQSMGPLNMKSPDDMKKGDTEGEVVQLAKDATETFWGSTYMFVEVKPIADKLIGNLKPDKSQGSYQIDYHYKWREAYKNKVRAGITGPGGEVGGPWGKADLESGGGAFKWAATLKNTAPGAYKAYMNHPGGIGLPSMSATESFSVVDPVKINLGSRRIRDIYDFDNPIPVQIEGAAELKFKLNANQVHSKNIGVAAGGSKSNGVSDKTSFGLKAGLDNDEGSKGGGEFGISSETQHNWQEQWKNETYSKQETQSGNWMEETFKPEEKGKGISKMIIPQYEWVEWDAEVYPHNPSTLAVTGGPDTVVIGMLRPTGAFKVQRSTDPGEYSDSNPTEGAQTDVDRSEKSMAEQHDAQVAARNNWRTLPGAKWGNDTLQFIQGPLSMTPAGRDYGMQDGRKVHPGEGEWSSGGSIGMTVEDGLTSSSSQDSSSVTTNNESKSFAAEPGIKGLGSIGTSLSFENSTSLSNGTSTGLSTTATKSEQTQIEVSHTVSKKKKQNQFVLFTPLVNHKVFKVAYGAVKPSDGTNAVNPEQACSIIYVHTYQHQPIPHVKVMDVGKHVTPKLGRYNWPEYTEV